MIVPLIIAPHLLRDLRYKQVRRVGDHGVEPAGLEDGRELRLPVEGIDPPALLVIGKPALAAFVVVGPDQRIAALDVAPQVGQRTLVVQPQLVGQRLRRFALQNLQQQRELRHFDRLRVDVHAVDVIEQNPFLLGGRQSPQARAVAVEVRRAPPGVLLGVVGHVPVAVPVEQKLVRPQQKRAAAAGRIDNPQARGFLGGHAGVQGLGSLTPGRALTPGPSPGRRGERALCVFPSAFRLPPSAFEEFSHRVADDVVDDVGGRIVDAAGLADLGLLLDLRLPSRS